MANDIRHVKDYSDNKRHLQFLLIIINYNFYVIIFSYRLPHMFDDPSPSHALSDDPSPSHTCLMTHPHIMHV